MSASELKGFLSLIILWSLRGKTLTGSQIADEIARRRGTKPSPGTIYPALKDLRTRGLIATNPQKVYRLTPKGEKELNQWLGAFCTIFSDFNEMKSCCKGCK